MVDDGFLTTRQIARLAPVISTTAIETIALGYLDLKEEWIESKKVQRKDQPEAFNRAVLNQWANKNDRQVKVSF